MTVGDFLKLPSKMEDEGCCNALAIAESFAKGKMAAEGETATLAKGKLATELDFRTDETANDGVGERSREGEGETATDEVGFRTAPPLPVARRSLRSRIL